MPHINGYNIFIYIIICIIIQMVSLKDNNILANFILADNLARFLCNMGYVITFDNRVCTY